MKCECKIFPSKLDVMLHLMADLLCSDFWMHTTKTRAHWRMSNIGEFLTVENIGSTWETKPDHSIFQVLWRNLEEENIASILKHRESD